MGCGSACSDNFVLSILPMWNQNFFFHFRAGKFSSAAPINDVGNCKFDESGRRQGAKRATARVARAMVTAMTRQSTVGGRWEGGA